jgi:hypothetical protein
VLDEELASPKRGLGACGPGEVVGVGAGVDGIQHRQPRVVDRPGGKVDRIRRLPRVLVDHQVVVSEPKTRAGRRSLALDPATVAALQGHLVIQAAERTLIGRRYVDSGLLFTWPDGRGINPAHFAAWFEQHITAAGLPRITLHGLRHSYATAALKAGVPVKVISERLGHATVAITLAVYSHVIPGMDELAATTVADLILGDGPANRTPERPVDKPVTSKPSSIERREEVEARRSSSAVVSEGGLEPALALL